jgi:hypothetical protein
MALVTASAVLFAVGLFALMATALGHRLLRLSSLEFEAEAEHLLCSAALGVICLEALLFLAQISGHIRAGVTTVLAVVLFFGRNNFVPVFGKVSSLVRRVLSGSPLEKFLIGLTGSVVLLEGLAAMAPVTGSDALHYHFTAPLLILRSSLRASSAANLIF